MTVSLEWRFMNNAQLAFLYCCEGVAYHSFISIHFKAVMDRTKLSLGAKIITADYTDAWNSEKRADRSVDEQDANRGSGAGGSQPGVRRLHGTTIPNSGACRRLPKAG